jgi:hypothetical protein
VAGEFRGRRLGSPLMGILIAAALFGAVTMMLPPLEAVELPPVSPSTE